MLDAVIYFCAFGVVEAVERTDEVPGNTSDTLKAHVFTDFIIWHGKPEKR